MDETNELIAYRANVERLAELDSPEVFSNSRPEHAVIILETFFKNAKDRVVVFCQKLSNRTYGGKPLIILVEKALRRGVKVRVVIQENPECQAFMEAAINWKTQNLPVVVSKADAGHRPVEVNFTVMDRKGYRFESNRQEPAAFACMNNPETAVLLLRRFFEIEQKSTPLVGEMAVPDRWQPHPA